MDTVLTYAILVGCIVCYTFQGLFGKLYANAYTGEESDATPVYSCLYGLIVGASVLSVAMGFRFQASAATWTLGIVCGLALFLYNLGVIKASLTGPFSLQSIFRMFGGVVVPMLWSMVFWGDRLTALQIIGIVIMLISFVVINFDGKALTGVKKGYVFWVALLFLVNGLYCTFVAWQQRVMAGAESNEMIVITFLSSSLISLVSLIASRKKETLKAFRMSKKAWGSVIGAGMVAALAVVQLMYLLTHMESLAVFYTIENGMVLVLTVVFSAILFKEKINRNVLIGIVMSVASLVLLSL